MRRFRAASVLVAGLGLACASPITVEEASEVAIDQRLTASVLSTGEPSPFAAEALHRARLAERYEDDPGGTLRALHERLEDPLLTGQRLRRHLSALAELSFHHAIRGGGERWFLASAVYAYAHLFPGDGGAGEEPPSALDPRIRLSADLYNRALTNGLQDKAGRIDLEPGIRELPFGALELEVAPEGFVWGGYRLVDFVAAAELQVEGVTNRYRRAGIGAPLAAAAEPTAATDQPQFVVVAPRVRLPVTLLLRIAEPRRGLREGRLKGRLELYASAKLWTEIDGERVPLEAETTAALAAGIADSGIHGKGLRGFLSGDFETEVTLETRNRIVMLHPYLPGRIPVVFVHGTASDPTTWTEMLNEIANDPGLRSRVQYWFFFYHSGAPILESAGALAHALRGAVAELDPQGLDPALQKVVVIGHSQGGMLSKLTVVESGAAFFEMFFDEPIDELDVTPDTRAFLDRTFFFSPVEEVERVVFISTPHRGSFLTENPLEGLANALLSVPGATVDRIQAIVERNPDAFAGHRRNLEELPTSLDNMKPGDPFLEVYGTLRVAPGVTVHSIIPVKDDAPLEEANDGVVKYTSAHLSYGSELIVHNSGHSAQQNADGIREVRRILSEHLSEVDSAAGD